jgi:hypothetical protein
MVETDTSPNGAAVGVEKKTDPAFVEIGATGLKRQAGRIDEEFLPELRGERGIKTLTEMSSNDGIVSAILFAVEMIIRGVEWTTIPGGTSPADAEAADFLASTMDDMSNSWPEFMSEAVSLVPYGWAYHEIVAKRRLGPKPKPVLIERPNGSVTEQKQASSKFDDGRVGIRKLPIRAQESLEEWIFDDEGGIAGLTQRPAPDYDLKTIPIQKALLFRTTAAKGNPEGRSALRGAYLSWYLKRAVQEIEAIGIERDLAGLPWARIPARFFKANATAAEKAALAEWVQTMRDIRVDSLQALVYPSEFDEHGNQLYEVGLMTTGGARAVDTGAVVQRYNVEMASVVLADFILLGHEKVGSFALASQKSDLFSVAVNGWLQGIAEILNRHLVPKLFEWNSFAITELPKFQPSVLGRVDLKELGDYISNVSGVGYDLFPNEALESALLQAAELPEPSDDERELRDLEEDEPPPPPVPPVLVAPSQEEDE